MASESGVGPWHCCGRPFPQSEPKFFVAWLKHRGQRPGSYLVAHRQAYHPATVFTMSCTRVLVAVGATVLLLQSLSYFASRDQSISGLMGSASVALKSEGNSIQFPRKIWQTSRLAPMALEQEYRDNVKRWNDVNPRWRHEILTDPGSDEYVRGRFGADYPEALEVYMGLSDNIMRADFFRYLVLLGDGGLYSDIDTEALKPIESWIPQEYKNQTNAVVGVEYDTFGQGKGQALMDLQLCNWTLMAKANHRLMSIVVANVIKALKALAHEQGVPLDQINANFNDVLSSTGPVQLTRSTWQYLTEVSGEEFTWQRVTGLKEPMLVHDLLILPVTAFGNGQAHSDAGPPTDIHALVHHQFKGTWKTGSHAYSKMKSSEKSNW